MLIDDLETETQRLKDIYEQLLVQEQLYRKTVDRSIRQEIAQTKKDLQSTKRKVRTIIMDHVYELPLLKKHFPEFFSLLLEDRYLGPILKQKSHWAQAQSPENPQASFAAVKTERAQLKEARGFVEKWVGEVDKKSIVATWPILKEYVSRETYQKAEMLEIIKKIDEEKKHQGWTYLIHKGLVEEVVNRYAKRLKFATNARMAAEQSMKRARGSGTVREYEALKMYEKCTRRENALEKRLFHLFLTNMEYFRGFKKMGKTLKTGGFSDSALALIRNAPLPKVDEKEWILEMKKKLEG